MILFGYIVVFEEGVGVNNNDMNVKIGMFIDVMKIVGVFGFRCFYLCCDVDVMCCEILY